MRAGVSSRRLPGAQRRRVPGVWLADQLPGLGVEGLDGDLVAEVTELADVVADLACPVPLLVVVVGAEVFVTGTGGGQELVVDAHLGVADRDAGFGLAAAAGELAVAGTLAGAGLPAATAVSPVIAPRYLLPLLCLACPARLPDCLSSGVRPAQEARWAGVGNRVMSAPVSARASSAERRPQPGMDSACCSCSSHGASSSSITRESRLISALITSIRSSMAFSRAAWAAVKNSAPSRACSSSVILRRALARPAAPGSSGHARRR